MKQKTTIIHKIFVNKLKFSCEIAHYGKVPFLFFQKISASTVKIYILGAGLSTR